MGLFDRFKRQRDPDEILEEVGQHLIKQAPSGFAVLWARCFMVNGSPDVTLFVQASESNPAVAPLALSPAQDKELRTRFTELWQAGKAAGPDPWTSAAFTISGEGDMDAGFSHEAVAAERVEELKQKWERKFLPGASGSASPPLFQPAINDVLKSLLETGLNELAAKASAHDALWQIRQAKQWSVNQEAGTIQFQFADGRTATALAQFIGSINTKNGTWLWAWDNPSITEPLRQHALAVRAFGEAQHHELLTTRKFPCDEELAWRLTALAAKLNNAQGAYRAPAGAALLFLTFGNVTLHAGSTK